MKKLSEYKGEEAIEILADLTEPAIEVFADKDFSRLIQGKQIPKAISAALKNHKTAVLDIMWVIDGKPGERAEYAPGVFALPVKLMAILNDPDMMSLFRSAGETADAISASASENTEAENE